MIGAVKKSDVVNPDDGYVHHVIIPVYIPNLDGYFKDSLKVLQYCLLSLFNTVHDRTFITLVNNGSCHQVKAYIEELYEQAKIHEIIHTVNVGKLNAILKGIAGNKIPLKTIADSDVLFCRGWQEETYLVFSNFPKAGVVGLTPQFKMFESDCGNLLFENLFSSKLKFSRVKNPDALEKFYESIGWDKNYNWNYLKYNLSIHSKNTSALVGSGHFVATYKTDIFSSLVSYIDRKMGADSEWYLDNAPLKKGLWRLTTTNNFAYHMGNVPEDWMEKTIALQSARPNFNFADFPEISQKKAVSNLEYFIKNRFFAKFFPNKFFRKFLYKMWRLPKSVRFKY